MGEEPRYIFTRPKQIPLFEEKDDGTLKQYEREK